MAKTTPVTPPTVNKNKKPKVHNIGVLNEILPIFRWLAQDEQDTIKMICIESSIPLAKSLTKDENQTNTLGAILTAGEDKNWKVRLTFA